MWRLMLTVRFNYHILRCSEVLPFYGHRNHLFNCIHTANPSPLCFWNSTDAFRVHELVLCISLTNCSEGAFTLCRVGFLRVLPPFHKWGRGCQWICRSSFLLETTVFWNRARLCGWPENIPSSLQPQFHGVSCVCNALGPCWYVEL